MSKQYFKALFLFGALIFSLSGVTPVDVEAMDLSSVANCDIEGQMQEVQSAECDIRKKGKVVGRIFITKTEASETEATYHITTECEECGDGARVNVFQENANSLARVREIVNVQAKEFSEQLELARDVRLCKKNEEGEKLNASQALECHMERLANETDEDKRRKIYDNNIRGVLHELASGNDPSKAVEAADRLHALLDVNCNDVPMRATMQSPQQQFNPYASTTSNAQDPTEYIRDSSCDLKAYGNYNRTLISLNQEVQMGMQMGNTQYAQAKLNEINGLQATWGTHFISRGIVVQNQTVQGMTMYNANLLTQYKSELDEQYKSILQRHQQLLGANEVAGKTTVNGTNCSRYVRGGATPDVPPECTVPATQNPGGAVLPFPTTGIPQMPAPSGNPVMTAPVMGTAVGG